MLYGFDGKEPKVGFETYVSDTAIVIGDVKIGDNCYIGHGAILRGDYGSIQIGNGTAVEEGVIVHAPPDDLCTIGDRVTIGHGAIIHSKWIGNHAVVGMGAILSVHSEVGEGSIIAEGCVVKFSQKIPGGVLAVGNPAKVGRQVTEAEKQEKEKRLQDSSGTQVDLGQLYIELAKKYLKIGMPRID
jgi:carbonic anhydrase/acetyltransferase-like protein (isoleucine patch superfamily)